MRSADGSSYALPGVAANSGTFHLEGGYYMMAASGVTWGGGSVEVQMLGPDGTTFLSLPTAMSLTADGMIGAALPPGTYKFTVTAATGGNASVARVPGD